VATTTSSTSVTEYTTAPPASASSPRAHGRNQIDTVSDRASNTHIVPTITPALTADKVSQPGSIKQPGSPSETPRIASNTSFSSRPPSPEVTPSPHTEPAAQQKTEDEDPFTSSKRAIDNASDAQPPSTTDEPTRAQAPASALPVASPEALYHPQIAAQTVVPIESAEESARLYALAEDLFPR
jgi:hypothetical protein